MIKKTIKDIPSFYAGDNTYLKELLHPKNDQIDLGYSLAYATIAVGEESLLHVMQQSELYIFLEGEALMIIDDETTPIKKGQIFLVPAGAKQFVKNVGKETLVFFCIVSPPWEEATEVIM